ncbi:phosphohistidine phosphatase SixA [Romeria aff. gracilis LEGE 07310]|uniref:Phosphohistidine phosphatase SixA n=1 Tax=Vasconcelosia minhoensis LEGE 07310 TaxID=915328 RepID=A0A8J7AK57_9CYAN|nr:phosphohistidine phosphatase SixA [Romeria gracilis]MBE9076710.1 phosphohistidine phosphatase SixA [Romeria aff. gracilis LEGE 07310]
MASSTPTEVYLIRHGIAAERGTYADDTQRPLTQRGRVKTVAIAQRLKQWGLRFDRMLTSPLVRARQTAEILQAAGLANRAERFEPLVPGGQLQTWLDWLAVQPDDLRSLALVGHEPDLSSWGERLVNGETNERWVLKKAGIIGLQLPVGESAIANSQLFWLAPPRFVL